MAEPHIIYNCETCMFLTRNKKDYARHMKTRKHLENHSAAAPDADTATTATTDTTYTDKDATHPSCAKCNKECKSHTKKYNSGVAPSPAQYDDPASLTLEQIQYILMENKILKELLVNAIQGHHQAAAVAAAAHSV